MEADGKVKKATDSDMQLAKRFARSTRGKNNMESEYCLYNIRFKASQT